MLELHALLGDAQGLRCSRHLTESRSAISWSHGARVSSVKRSLLDGAARMDLIGGAGVLAEALAVAQPNPAVLHGLAQEIGAAAACAGSARWPTKLDGPLTRQPAAATHRPPAISSWSRGIR